MRPITAAALISFMLATSMTALPAFADDARGTISISGLGEVTAAPDTAFITSASPPRAPPPARRSTPTPRR